MERYSPTRDERAALSSEHWLATATGPFFKRKKNNWLYRIGCKGPQNGKNCGGAPTFGDPGNLPNMICLSTKRDIMCGSEQSTMRQGTLKVRYRKIRFAS